MIQQFSWNYVDQCLHDIVTCDISPLQNCDFFTCYFINIFLVNMPLHSHAQKSPRNEELMVTFSSSSLQLRREDF